MGGTSTSQQTQQSTTNPWAPAQPMLQGILGQLNSSLPNTGITGAQTGAINTIEQNANSANQFTPQINQYTGSLLNGGGALSQAGNIQNGFDAFRAQTNPLASNTNYNPMSTPGIGDALGALNSDITQQINGQFAAAGRDGSGYNQQALARGLSQGEGQLLANQYNQNVQNQQQAAGNLYNAGNTNAGLLSGLQQQFLANQGAGVQNVGAGLDAQNAGASSVLQAEAQKFGIPVQNLGLLANIGVPIAGLGGQSSGTASGSSTMSPVQQFAMITGGLGSLFGGGPKPSDVRLKQDIKHVGTLDNGLPVYLYRYKSGGPFEIGLMAQDVEKVAPEAVHEINGFKAVDYKLATDRATEGV